MRAWLARDRDGFLKIYNRYPPMKNNKTGLWETGSPFRSIYSMSFIEETLPEGINPQWTDENPTEVELKVEKI